MTGTDAPERRVAAFDFDGTISRRDTLLGFLVSVGGPAAVGTALAVNAVGLGRGLRDDTARDMAKERVLGRVLRGKLDADLVMAGEAYAARVASTFRPETLAAIRRHRAEGHETVIVSASLVYYLRPVARELGIDDVIAVEMATDSEGRLTGDLLRPNVRAEQKAVRLHEWLGTHPGSPIGVTTGGDIELWAYGDSSGDEALLALADHPQWVGRRSQ